MFLRQVRTAKLDGPPIAYLIESFVVTAIANCD
jgi:hypothetical protein